MPKERVWIDGDRVMVGDREMTRIFSETDPELLNGTYDVYGFKPAERRALERRERAEMAKSKPNGKHEEEPKRKGARSQTLPGMDGKVRSHKLDNLCEAISEHREQINSARTEEQSDIAAALQEMQKKNLAVYKHGGIELARVPGAEKLRVRTVKEQGDADDDDLESTEDADFDGIAEEAAAGD